MSEIGIVGAGISGLTLALRLQQLGVDTTLYAEAPPEAMRAGPLPNTVGRFPHTLARERLLGVDHWPQTDYAMGSIQFWVGSPLGIRFEGHFGEAIRAVDFRVLLPRFLEDYVERGGRVVVQPGMDAAAVEQRSTGHDLVVVAVGRRSMASLFRVDPERSPYSQPQRVLFAGLFDGLEVPMGGAGPALSLNNSPGVGEIAQMAMWTAEGLATNLLVDAVPGGPLAPLAELPPTAPDFPAHLAGLLRAHAPAVAERVQPGRFALRGPTDWIQGALTPTVRRAWSELGSGRLAVAIGDAWITNDPLTGQGANVASHCAWVAADHIAAGGPFDRVFGQRLEQSMWDYAGVVTDWTNHFLQPPPPHVVELNLVAARHPAVADRLVRLFADPPAMVRATASPESVAAFVDESLAAGVQATAAG